MSTDVRMSDATTTLAELKIRVARFSDERAWAPFHGAKDLAIGVATEVAELLEIFRFQPEAETDALMADPERRRRVENELADVIFFVARLAQRYDIDLADAFERKLALNAERYPVDSERTTDDLRTVYRIMAAHGRPLHRSDAPA